MNKKLWNVEKTNKWYEKQPWLVGCNFIPSNAINQLEMWQPDSFDLETINSELGYAARLGFNITRVYLHDLLHKTDPDGFKDRIKQYLEIADSYHIKTMFVFFDDCWNPNPLSGKQPEPVLCLHNAHWVESPGLSAVENFQNDSDIRNHLKFYVQDILSTFQNDSRILLWDLYNEPGGFCKEPGGRNELVGDRCIHLLEAVFEWAREVYPSQPLTSGVFANFRGETPDLVSRTQFALSDIISFHNYLSAERMESDIKELKEKTGRPLICSEYLARPYGSTFEAIMPILKKHRVGAINWGLVAGKTQTIYPWDSWEKKYTSEPEVWFHDIFRQDEIPFSSEEALFIRSITS